MEYRLSNEEIIHCLKQESNNVMKTLAEAMMYKEHTDSEGNVYPPECMWGDNTPETAAQMVLDEMRDLRFQLQAVKDERDETWT